jgi:carboxylesterase type B
VGVAQEAANLHEAGADVFLYSFDYDSETLPGHGKELAYLFPGNRRTSEVRLSKKDELISTRMVEMWANFIKSG